MRRDTKAATAERDAAGHEALKGAIAGAAKYGALTLLLSTLLYTTSPLYRSLTIQFKAFLQMSGMTLGGMLGADRRVREYEFVVRAAKKRRVDEVGGRRWEGEKGRGKGG